MTWLRAVRVAVAGGVAGFWMGLRANPNATVFLVGLGVLCVSVAAWSRPLAGTILGIVLMAVAAWPFVAVHRGE